MGRGGGGDGAGDWAWCSPWPSWAEAGRGCCQDQPAKVRQEHTVGSYVWSHDCAHCSVERVTDAGHCQVMVSMDGSGDMKFGSHRNFSQVFTGSLILSLDAWLWAGEV